MKINKKLDNFQTDLNRINRLLLILFFLIILIEASVFHMNISEEADVQNVFMALKVYGALRILLFGVHPKNWLN